MKVKATNLDIDALAHDNVMKHMLQKMEAVDREYAMEETPFPDIPRIADEKSQDFALAMLNSSLRYLFMDLLGASRALDDHPDFHPLDPTIELLQTTNNDFHKVHLDAAVNYLRQVREAERRPDCAKTLLRIARVTETSPITEQDILLQMLQAILQLHESLTEIQQCSSHPDS